MKLNCAIERLLLSVGLAVSAIVGGQLPLRAEASNPVSTNLVSTSVPETAPLAVAKLAMRPLASGQASSEPIQMSSASFSSDSAQAPSAVLASALAPAAAPVASLPLNQSESSPASTPANTDVDPLMANASALAVPVPGTVSTSVAALTPDAASLDTANPATVERQQATQTGTSAIVQAEPITPGRATRSGSSYVGLGVNIGAIGRTPLGDLSGAILSKIGLTRTISVRPAVLINGDATFLLPITLDFPIESAGRVSFAPYVGVGASFSTGDRKNADLIVSGGVDIPLSSQFTLTAAANAGLINGVELGVLVGIGYNFAGF